MGTGREKPSTQRQELEAKQRRAGRGAEPCRRKSISAKSRKFVGDAPKRVASSGLVGGRGRSRADVSFCNQLTMCLLKASVILQSPW